MDPSSLNAKRQRLVQHPILKEDVALWVLKCQHHGVIITGDIIGAKAHRLAQLLGTPDDAITFSHGWLHKFQQCHMLRAINIYGEAARWTQPTYCHALFGAWNEISSTTIANCFSHTRLFSTESVISSAVEVERSKYGATEIEEEESELEQELIAQLKKLRVRDPMKISELLDPIEEDETAQPELTDNEILKEVLEADDEEENGDDAAHVADKFTRTEKINLLRDACSLLDVFQGSHQAAYRVLRNLQLDLLNTPTTQTTLDMWFK
uniref:HTH CENPB-type domain-containing protein n=1 Tax=Hyaloperonospora arabidopsidis (strain Emoy2) TaxID=559515 RepID=M4BCE5_HYAAE